MSRGHEGGGEPGRMLGRLRDHGVNTASGHVNEAEQAELGERAQRGLRSENDGGWGRRGGDATRAAISRRAGEEGGALKDAKGRTSW